MTEVCHGAVQGDIQIIPDWKKSHTLDQLKAIVEDNGYSAVCVAGKNEFGHAAIKSFDYQLTAERCKPSSGYTCTIWIYQRPKGVKPKPQMPAMVLTSRGSYNECRFTEATMVALKSGQEALLSLESHPGYAIGKMYTQERRAGPWRYIESELVAATDAVHAEWDGNFVMMSGHDLCLDVAFWKMEEGNVVNFVGGTGCCTPTKMGGGGRDWVANKDGTISAKHHPHLVLGLSGPVPSGPFAPKWCQLPPPPYQL